MVQLTGYLEVLKTLHDVFASVPASPVVYALVLDTVSVRDIATGKCQVGLNLVTKFRCIRRPPCILKTKDGSPLALRCDTRGVFDRDEINHMKFALVSLTCHR